VSVGVRECLWVFMRFSMMIIVNGRMRLLNIFQNNSFSDNKL